MPYTPHPPSPTPVKSDAKTRPQEEEASGEVITTLDHHEGNVSLRISGHQLVERGEHGLIFLGKLMFPDHTVEVAVKFYPSTMRHEREVRS